MKKIISTTALSSILLCGSLMSVPLMAQQQAGILKASDSWGVKQIGQGAQSYCALSRSYEEDLILTFGRNVGKEYSLAIDFQSADLNISKSYKVALQPGPGQVRAYQLRPASQRAMVVRLGEDKSFFTALEQSRQLKAQIEGKDYIFDLSDFSKGQSTLNECMNKLGGSSVKTAEVNPAVPVSKIEKPEKIITPQKTVNPDAVKQTTSSASMVKNIPDTAKPVPAKQAEDVSTPRFTKEQVEKQIDNKVAKKIEPAVKVSRYKELESAPPTDINSRNSLSSFVSKSSSAQRAETSPTEPVKPSILSERPEIPKTVSKTMPKPEVVASKTVSVEKPEITQEATAAEKISPAKPIVKKQETPPVPSSVTAMTEEPRKAVEVSRAVTKRPPLWNDTLEKQQQDELERIKAENKRLNEALRAQINNPMATQARSSLSAEQGENLSDLKGKIAELEKKLEQEKLEPPVISSSMAQELEKLRAENRRLASSMKSQGDKMDSFDVQSPMATKELNEMRQEVALLKTENERLAKEAMKAHSKIDSARVDMGNRTLDRVKEYEKRLQAATEDNLVLSRQIEQMKRVQGSDNIKAVSGDWDLEKSTRRYNEAEREIKRLGMLLEQQRTAHRAEKIQLEQMLFDPAVTDKEQRRRLVELESKLLAAERQLEIAGRARPQDRYDGTLASLQSPTQLSRAVAVPAMPVAREVISQSPRAPQMAPRAIPQQVTPQVVPQKVMPQTVASTSLSVPPPTMRPPLVQERRTTINNMMPDVAERPVQQAKPAGKNMDLQNLLRQAGVKSTPVTDTQNGQYEWRAGNVSGLAQVKPKGSYRNIEQFAQQYISNAKKSCKGDFASSEASQKRNLKSYDIVCLDGRSDTASSVVFAEKGSDILAIAHMADTENLDQAIDLRDRVADKL